MPNRAIIQSLRLKSISTGPAAIRLPPAASHLTLSFGKSNTNGHMGPRKFAQLHLPSLAYHNPRLVVNVTRIAAEPKTKNEGVDAILHIKDESNQTVSRIDVRGLHSDEIVQRILAISGAEKVVSDPVAAVEPAATSNPSLPI